jgi:hypothetical protein
VSFKALKHIKIALAIVGIVALAPAGLVSAKGGVSGGGGSTPLVAGPCVQLTAKDGTRKVSGPTELRFTAKSCSSKAQTVPTVVTDSSYRTLYPEVSCGDRTISGPTLQLAAGQSVDFVVVTQRGTCSAASSETHNIAVSALASDGTALSTAYTQWYEDSSAESI